MAIDPSKAIEESKQPLEPQRVALEVSPESIQETTRSIALLQNMVKEVLVRGIDYGHIPGTPQDSLWEPGASQIIGSFHCYCGQRRIIKLEDTNEKIVVCVEVPIISRSLQIEVASGIGAASTLETKYKYRWVSKPKDWGYDEEAVKTFKTKQGKEEGRDVTLYRIPNPEHSELLNTIVKMASKRAEVDAAESLPGVSSVLRQMFSASRKTQDQYPGPRWQRFWGEVTKLGYTRDEVHTKFRVASMHDWLAKGRSLDEALDILRRDGNPEQTDQESEVDLPWKDKKRPEPNPNRDPESLKNINDLLEACFADFGLQPADVARELGHSSTQDITRSPAACYQEIAAVRKPPKEE
jgi:hypothetical protein